MGQREGAQSTGEKRAGHRLGGNSRRQSGGEAQESGCGEQAKWVWGTGEAGMGCRRGGWDANEREVWGAGEEFGVMQRLAGLNEFGQRLEVGVLPQWGAVICPGFDEPVNPCRWVLLVLFCATLPSICSRLPRDMYCLRYKAFNILSPAAGS